MNPMQIPSQSRPVFKLTACSVLLLLYEQTLAFGPALAGINPGCELAVIDPLYHHQVCIRPDPSAWAGGPSVLVETAESLVIKEAAAKLGCWWVPYVPALLTKVPPT